MSKKVYMIIFLLLILVGITLTATYATNMLNNNSIQGNSTNIPTNSVENIQNIQDNNKGLGLIAVALSTGLACVGAGIAVAFAASSAIGAISENPKLLGKTIIFAGLAEGIAIYGLIISIMILNKI